MPWRSTAPGGHAGRGPLRLAPHISRGEWRLALWKLRLLAADDAAPNEVLHNAVISACKVSRCWRPALQLLSRANTLTFNVAASALGLCQIWRGGLLLLQQMLRRFLRPDIVNLNTSIHIRKGAGQWPASLATLRAARIGQLQPDQVSSNTCMAACQSNAWQRALLFQPKDAAGALALTSSAGLWPNALLIFWRMAELCVESVALISA
ncbi:unnamed protein product, partial [Effrenium voratum]